MPEDKNSMSPSEFFGTSSGTKIKTSPSTTLSPEQMFGVSPVQKDQFAGQTMKSDSPWIRGFRENVAPQIRTILDTIGMAGGATLGATAGLPTGPGAAATGALGGVLGHSLVDQLYQQAQRLAPSYFGQAPDGVLNSLKETGEQGILNAGVETGMNIVGSGVKKVLKGVVNPESLFSPSLKTSASRAALQTPEGSALNPSVGQKTGNENAQFLENILTKKKKNTLIDTQQKTLAEQAANIQASLSPDFVGIKTGDLSPADIAKSGEEKAGNLFQKAKDFKNSQTSEKFRWEKAKSLISQETDHAIQQIQSGVDSEGNKQMTSRLVPMQGPVNISNTQLKASEIEQDIQESINATTNDGTKSYLEKLKAYVTPYVNPPTSATSGKPILPYNGLKNDADRFNLMIRNKDTPPEVKREVGLLGALATTINGDIDETAKTSWSTQSRQAYQQAKAKTKGIAKAFYGDADLGNLDPDLAHKAALREALASPDAARQYRMQTGNRTELGAEYFRNILDNAQDPNGYFDGTKARQMFADTGDVAKQVASSDLRNQWDQLFKRMEAVQPTGGTVGDTSFKMRLGNAMFMVGGGIVGGLVGGSTGALTTGLTLIGGAGAAHSVVNHLFYNSRAVNLLSQLVKAKPGSYAATTAFKTLLKGALNGAVFSSEYGNLKAIDGKLVPANDDSSK